MDIQEVLAKTTEKMTVTDRSDGTQSSDHRQQAEYKFFQAFAEDAATLKAEKAERIRRESSLGARFARRTFENFDIDRDPEAYDKCFAYVGNYRETERNCLLIVGGYGSGKTHLAASIANWLMDYGTPVLFDTFGGHLNKLKTEFNGGRSTYLEQMKTIEMLILDDVGKEKQSDWTRSIMFDVINYRYEHLLPIVLTTNLKNEALKDYLGGAVWSRLCEMCSGVNTKGGDYRQKCL